MTDARTTHLILADPRSLCISAIQSTWMAQHVPLGVVTVNNSTAVAEWRDALGWRVLEHGETASVVGHGADLLRETLPHLQLRYPLAEIDQIDDRAYVDSFLESTLRGCLGATEGARALLALPLTPRATPESWAQLLISHLQARGIEVQMTNYRSLFGATRSRSTTSGEPSQRQLQWTFMLGPSTSVAVATGIAGSSDDQHAEVFLNHGLQVALPASQAHPGISIEAQVARLLNQLCAEVLPFHRHHWSDNQQASLSLRILAPREVHPLINAQLPSILGGLGLVAHAIKLTGIGAALHDLLLAQPEEGEFAPRRLALRPRPHPGSVRAPAN